MPSKQPVDFSDVFEQAVRETPLSPEVKRSIRYYCPSCEAELTPCYWKATTTCKCGQTIKWNDQ